MGKKEQTNGGSHLEIGAFTTDENRNLNIPPEKAKRLSIVDVAKLKELEETGYIEIKVDYHDVYKESEKIVKRVKDGKTLTSNEEKTTEAR